jgi:hypothetical protein
MRYALMIEPQQGCSYDDQLAIARRAEAAGFEAFFRSDHYDSFPGESGRPTTDAWTVLAGLARETERILLGVLVSPVTFRHPGTLAKIVATVDEMSGGRVVVGLGAGWNKEEHAHHGLTFPPIDVRADMLEEQLAILRGLWQEPDGWSFTGRHYSVPGSLFRPRPVQQPAPHVIVGGEGSPRSMRIAGPLDPSSLALDSDQSCDPDEVVRGSDQLRRESCLLEPSEPSPLQPAEGLCPTPSSAQPHVLQSRSPRSPRWPPGSHCDSR